LGENAPVLCGNSTDSIGCPFGYYCRTGPPDVCCPDHGFSLLILINFLFYKKIIAKKIFFVNKKMGKNIYHFKKSIRFCIFVKNAKAQKVPAGRGTKLLTEISGLYNLKFI
jgi:hypothetical protein